MLIVGVLCVCAAIAAGTFGLWSISRPPAADPATVLRHAQAPTQLAAGVMLASGGAVALAAPRAAVVVVITCVAGAVGTVAAGSWQSARYALRRESTSCVGSCAGCPGGCAASR